MKLGTLQVRHPSVNIKRTLDKQALYKGGDLFEARLNEFLHRSASDDDYRYYVKKRICANAYVNHSSAIVGFYSGFLFANPITIRPVDENGSTAEVDSFYSEFKDDCDGSRKDYQQFLKERFEDSSWGNSYWIRQLPMLESDPSNRLEWEESGAGRAELSSFDATETYDWQKDDDGNFVYIVFGRTDRVRQPFGVSLARKRFWLYDSENVICFEHVYDPLFSVISDETDIPIVAKYAHGFGSVPVNCIYENGLMEILRGPILDYLAGQLRIETILNSSANPIGIFLTDDEKFAPTNSLTVQMSKDSNFKMSTPPSEAIEWMSKTQQEKERQLYKLVNLQNSAGQDNSSYSLVRSGKSRILDLDAGKITMKGYAAAISEAGERDLTAISEARGESGFTWQTEDFEQLESMDLPTLVTQTLEIKALGIPSPTLIKELYKKIGAKSIPDRDEKTKARIIAEIESATTEELMAPVVATPVSDGIANSNQTGQDLGKGQPSKKPETTQAKAN